MVGLDVEGHVGFQGMQDQDVLSAERVLSLSLGHGAARDADEQDAEKQEGAESRSKQSEEKQGVTELHPSDSVSKRHADSFVNAGHFTHFYLTGLKKTRSVF